METQATAITPKRAFYRTKRFIFGMVGLAFILTVGIVISISVSYKPKLDFRNPTIDLSARVLNVTVDITAKTSSSKRTFSDGYIKVRRCGALIVDTELKRIILEQHKNELKDQTMIFPLLQKVTEETVSKVCPDHQYEYEYDFKSIHFGS